MKFKTLDDLNNEVEQLTVDYFTYNYCGVTIGPFKTYEEAKESRGDDLSPIGKTTSKGFEAAKMMERMGIVVLFSTIKE